jgi:plastocyanin
MSKCLGARALLIPMFLVLANAGGVRTVGAATHTITMEAVAFAPALLTVQPGDTVRWLNKDPFPHTATAVEHSFDSGEIAPNKEWKLKVGKVGTFPYVCALHPTMKGTLIVRSAGAAASGHVVPKTK